MVSRRGEHTRANDVSSECSSRSARAARSLKPSSIPSNCVKNWTVSATTCPPATFDIVRSMS